MRIGLAALLAALGLGATAAPAGGGVDGPTGTLVVVHRSEDRLTSIDLATGKRRTVRATWLARCAAAPQVIGGQLVVAGHRGRRAVTFALDPGLRGPRRGLGPAWMGVASAATGRMWLIDPPPRHHTRLPGVREVNLDGRVTFRTRAPLPPWSLVGAVTEGLLFEHDEHLLVWDPRAARVTRRVPGVFVVGTRGSVVAFCGRGECRRGLQLVDMSDGRRTVIRSPRWLRLEPSGAFSPTGWHVAVTARAGGKRVVALIDLASRRVSVVPGSRAHRFYPSLTWSPSGDWLLWNAGGGALMAHRPGYGVAVRFPFRIPRAMSLAAG